MCSRDEIQYMTEQLRSAADPVAKMQKLVLGAGGYWANANYNGLFEVYLMGVPGIGRDACSAVNNWLRNAEQRIRIDTAV